MARGWRSQDVPHDFLFVGVFCASSTTYALRRTLEDAHASPIVRDVVSKSMYVDDLLHSTPDKSIIEYLVHDVKTTLSKGGFLLTKFVVNDPDLLQQIPEKIEPRKPKSSPTNFTVMLWESNGM